MQHLIGSDRARMLDVQVSGGCLGLGLPHFIRVLLRLGEQLEDRVQEPLGVFIDLFSQQVMERMVQYFDQYKKRQFAVPAKLRVRWLGD